MESLTPPVLTMAQELYWMISSGRSMREAMRVYLSRCPSFFAIEVCKWWSQVLQTDANSSNYLSQFTPHQQALLELVTRSAGGQPILEPLRELTCDIEMISIAELELHVSTLPFKLLIPLLFFYFPAFLILLLGPLIRDMQTQLGG